MKLAIVAAGFTPAEANRCAARWRHSAMSARSTNSKPRWSRAWSRADMSAISRSAATIRSRGSAATAFPKAMRCRSRGWSTYRRGSNAIIRRCSPAGCSIRSRWGSMRRRRSSREAQENGGVEVRPIDVNASTWDNSLEPGDHGLALRLGFRQIDGFREDWADKLPMNARRTAPSPRSKNSPAARICRRARCGCSPMPMPGDRSARDGAMPCGRCGARRRTSCRCSPRPVRANWGRRRMPSCPPCR